MKFAYFVAFFNLVGCSNDQPQAVPRANSKSGADANATGTPSANYSPSSGQVISGGTPQPSMSSGSIATSCSAPTQQNWGKKDSLAVVNTWTTGEYGCLFADSWYGIGKKCLGNNKWGQFENIGGCQKPLDHCWPTQHPDFNNIRSAFLDAGNNILLSAPAGKVVGGKTCANGNWQDSSTAGSGNGSGGTGGGNGSGSGAGAAAGCSSSSNQSWTKKGSLSPATSWAAGEYGCLLANFYYGVGAKCNGNNQWGSYENIDGCLKPNDHCWVTTHPDFNSLRASLLIPNTNTIMASMPGGQALSGKTCVSGNWQ